MIGWIDYYWAKDKPDDKAKAEPASDSGGGR